ncbi:MAG: CHAT domain-containing tetratricopeptide repeat protein, partial [Acidobacteriota bacterium]
KLKRYAEAEANFLEAERASAEIKNTNNWVKALLELGNVNRLTGKQAKALEYYDRTYELSERYGIKEVLWRAAAGKAALLRVQGKREEALEWYARAVDIVERLRAALKIDEFRNSFQVNKQDLYQDIISLLVEMGRTEEAFNYLERSRSRSFIDLLGNQKLTLKNEVDQRQLEHITKLSRRVDALAAEIASFETAPQGLQEQYRETKTIYEEALLVLKQNNPALSSFVAVVPLTQGEVQRMLKPGVGLLSYKLAGDRTYVWLLKADGTLFYQVPAGKEQLAALVKRYRSLVQRLEPVGEEVEALYGLLIGPVENDLQGLEYVGIIPDDALHYLSFAALKDKEGYLVDRYPIFYTPSASVLKYTFAKRGKAKQTKVLAVGNPDLGHYNYDLPLAELEARSIRWNFPDMDILTGSKATKEWLLENISNYGIIHLAVHGEFDEFNPLLSSLWLASPNPDNRRLTVKEVFSLDLKADLVTLSACQTGLGKLRAGELIGLNRAFIYAGTHALLSALWRVDDLSTSLLMKHFYRNYVRMDKAKSLRQAQLRVKKDFPHPAYWAGMSLVGDYL